MTTSVGDNKRRIIPRWRDALSSSALGEFEPIRPSQKTLPPNPAQFEAVLEEWRISPSIPTAFEVLVEGVAHGRIDESIPAAKFLHADPDITPLVRALANSVLEQALPAELPITGQMVEDTGPISSARIASIRRILRDVPHNPLLWVDLSREYILKGQHRQSLRAMEVALTLGPDVRFVLRSAARLFIHRDDVSRALFYLNRSQRTHRDPWLLAAHIASSEIAEAPQKFIKEAKSVQSSSNFSSRNISELSGALATLDFASGNFKGAKRNFKLSLEEPTENAVAQAVHAQSQSLKIDISPEILVSTTRTYEAKALTEFMNTNWQLAINASTDWFKDEPFSTRPLRFASFISSVALNNHTQSRKFALLGLDANPGNPELLNNLAVAEAYLGNVEAADHHLSQISPTNPGESGEVTTTATKGLIAFRKGYPDEGRAQYEAAIQKAAENDNLRALAFLHLTREELRIESGRERNTFELALKYLSKVHGPNRLPLLAMAVMLDEGLRAAPDHNPHR